jgi:2-methylisocitrate lyase-like PEP mutase family enzyme
MGTIAEKAARFRSLHVRGRPLVLFNIWDAGSARAVADAGAQALAPLARCCTTWVNSCASDRLPLSVSSA